MADTTETSRLRFGLFHFFVVGGCGCYRTTAFFGTGAEVTAPLGRRPDVSGCKEEYTDRIAAAATKAAGRAWRRLLTAKIGTPEFLWTKKEVRHNG